MAILWAGTEDIDFQARMGCRFSSLSAPYCRPNYARGAMVLEGTSFAESVPVPEQSEFWYSERRFPQWLPPAGTLITFMNGAGTVFHIRAGSTTAGLLTIVDLNGTVLGTAAVAMPTVPATLYKMDVHFLAAVDGYIQVFLNGSSLPIVQFLGNTSSMVGVTGVTVSGAGGVSYVSECVLATTETRFLSVKSLFVNAPGTSNSWGSGTYADISEADQDPGTVLVATASTQEASFNLADLAYPGFSVKQVRANVATAKGAAGPQELEIGVRTGGTTHYAAGQAVSEAWTTKAVTWDVNPGTGQPWTEADLQSLQLALRSDGFIPYMAAIPSIVKVVPTFSGIGELGSTVYVRTAGGTLLASGVVQADRSWTATPAPMSDGPYTVYAEAVNGGTTSPSTPQQSFTIDTVPPAITVTAGSLPGLVLVNTVTATGTSEAGATVWCHLTADQNSTFASAIVAGNGTWSMLLTSPADGSYDFRFYAVDIAGNRSTSLGPYTVMFRTVLPAPPVLTSNGPFQYNENVVITASAVYPGTVRLYEAGVGQLQSGATAANGSIVFTVTTASGYHDYYATVTDDYGLTSNFSVASRILKYAPPITLNTLNAYYNVLPTFSGTGISGDTVTVEKAGGQVLAATVVGGGGTWSVTASNFSDGLVSASAYSTTAGGTPSPRTATQTFTLDRIPPAAPTLANAGPFAWNTDPCPIPIYSDSGNVVTLTNSSGTVLGSGTAVSGALTINVSLPSGNNTINGRARDPAGNDSSLSSAVYVKNFLATVTPTFTSVNGYYSYLPTFTGTGGSGNTITVYRSGYGTVLATTTVAGNGTWSVPCSVALVDGSYTVYCQASSPGGTSGTIAGGTFILDRGAPTKPTLVAGGPYASSGQVVVPITVYAEAYSTVRLYSSAGLIGTGTSSVNASVAISVTLGIGTTSIYATSTDYAGNVSPNSDSVAYVASYSPTVNSFSSSAYSIVQGSSATLSWSTSNATSVTLNPGNINVTSVTSYSVSPGASTTYTLIAANVVGESFSQLSITVTAPPPIISSFYASPATIQLGNSSTLYWSVANTTSLVLNPGSFDVTGTGGKLYIPSATTTYTLSASGPGGSTSASTVITVTAPPPVAQPTIGSIIPASIYPNQGFTARGTGAVGNRIYLIESTDGGPQTQSGGYVLVNSSGNWSFPGGVGPNPGVTYTYWARASDGTNWSAISSSSVSFTVLDELEPPK